MRLVEMFQQGGAFMYPILIVFVFAMAISFERLFYVMWRANTNATQFMAQIQKLIMAGNLDRAIQLCNANPHQALPRVVKAGLTHANQPEEDLAREVDEAILTVTPQVNKRTPYLVMLANVATLTGLLGTIWGLIMAFEAVAAASAEMKQQLLAQGISVAMYTTAGGLMVAIPTMILTSIIQGQSTRILDDVEQFGLKTVNLLVARKRSGSGAAAAEA